MNNLVLISFLNLINFNEYNFNPQRRFFIYSISYQNKQLNLNISETQFQVIYALNILWRINCLDITLLSDFKLNLNQIYVQFFAFLTFLLSLLRKTYYANIREYNS